MRPQGAGTPAFQPGDIVDERYVVEKPLGSGSFGVVVAARSVADGERVALKIMMRELLDNAEILARFLREAQAAATLESPHTARVLDVRRLRGGVPYLVMELLDGVDLETYVTSKGPLPVAEAVALVSQACDALEEAHARGIVHRDLKLQNMFLTRSPEGTGQLKILDFGIAKMSPAPGQIALTASSVAFGSPQYMSPEQLRSTKDVDARSDLWSLGVCLYELLTGKMPFEGASQPLLFAAILGYPPAPLRPRRPEVTPDLEAIVMRCLAKEPGDRWQSAAEMKSALATWSLKNTGKDVLDTPPPAPSVRMTASPAGTASVETDRTLTQDQWEVMTGVRRPIANVKVHPRRSSASPWMIVGVIAAILLLLVVAATVGFLIGRTRGGP
jgi:serine/threonine-protein kinase